MSKAGAQDRRSAQSRTLRHAERACEGGDLAKAERLYLAALRDEPDSFDALHGRGLVHFRRGRNDAALPLIQSALRRQPWRVDGLASLGLVFHALKDFSRALASFDSGLQLAPNDTALLNGRGVAMLELGRAQDALESFERALRSAPDHLDALGNRANALLRLNRVGEALAAYDLMLQRARGNARLLANRAVALRRLDRPREALTSAQQALASEPDFAQARFIASLARLSLGDFAGGWRDYEARWGVGWLAAQRRNFSAPLWLGNEPLAGKTLLLHAEQGLGDTIQFMRYAPLLAARGATIVLEVQPPLARLVARMAGVAAVCARGEKLPDFDFHCPLLSLPLACATTLDTIPAQTPYIAAANAEAARWRARLSAQRPCVGLVWSGERSHENDLNRSMPLAALAPLLDLRGIAFVSLQHEVREQDRALLTSRTDVLHIGGEFCDFAETAAAVTALDAVVAVDTAVAHLTGALGKPLFLMLPFAADFRWLRERSDSPWYPSARLFRQPQFGDWAGAVKAVRGELALFATQWGRAA
jgi:tetratricopeptide (TPR) repeat protein